MLDHTVALIMIIGALIVIIGAVIYAWRNPNL